MQNNRLFHIALAGLTVGILYQAHATTIQEDFANDPTENGWRIFGNADQFAHDALNERLAVTWDSSSANSYFHLPLGTILSRDSDFSFEFDLHLTDAASGNEPGKTGGMQLVLGFLNLEEATSTNFMRAAFGKAPNVVEFDYFPAGYYEGFGDVPATTTPTFIGSNGFAFAPSIFVPYQVELPTNQWIHVSQFFTASNQTLVISVTTNGVPLANLPDVVLDSTNTSSFGPSDDFRVDTFSISSYSSAGNDFDSVLAHGWVDNIVVTVPAPPLDDIAGAFSNSVWQVQFTGQSNWLYSLERTTDFAGWSQVDESVATQDGNMTLEDGNPPPGGASYRVSAERP